MEKIQAEVPKLNREQINFFLNLNNPEEKQKFEELASYREKNAHKSTPIAARALLFECLDTYEEMQDLRRKNEEANAKITEANIKYADSINRNQEAINQLRAENKQQNAKITEVNSKYADATSRYEQTINQLLTENKQQAAIIAKLKQLAMQNVNKIHATYPDLSATEIIEISVAYLQDCLSQEQSWGAILSSPTLPSKFIKQNKK